MRTIFIFIKDNVNNDENATLVANSMRYLLTLFKINRVKSDYSELNVKNLKLSFKIPSDVYNSFEHYARKRLEDIPKKEVDLTAIPIFGSANGPNASPKLDSADSEAYKIVFVDKEIKGYLYDLIDHTANYGFKNYIESRAESFKKFLKEQPEKSKIVCENIYLRKLQSIPDRGNKSRVIAMCDY